MPNMVFRSVYLWVLDIEKAPLFNEVRSRRYVENFEAWRRGYYGQFSRSGNTHKCKLSVSCMVYIPVNQGNSAYSTKAELIPGRSGAVWLSLSLAGKVGGVSGFGSVSGWLGKMPRFDVVFLKLPLFFPLPLSPFPVPPVSVHDLHLTAWRMVYSAALRLRSFSLAVIWCGVLSPFWHGFGGRCLMLSGAVNAARRVWRSVFLSVLAFPLSLSPLRSDRLRRVSVLASCVPRSADLRARVRCLCPFRDRVPRSLCPSSVVPADRLQLRFMSEKPHQSNMCIMHKIRLASLVII